MIIDDRLREYANLLEDNGFVIYEPKGNGNFFRYSQLVGGKECFGFVQRKWGTAGHTYTHTMPIQPTIEHGASLSVAGAEGLTVEAARRVAQPFNRNETSGAWQNYADPSWDQLYDRRTVTFMPITRVETETPEAPSAAPASDAGGGQP